ncbi:MAG: hypothetical protein WCS67_07905 [Bacteroidales bacterium]
MLKEKGNILLVAIGLVAVLLAGCTKIKDISVTSCEVKSVTPRGFSALKGVLMIGIDNPAFTFTISDISGVVKYNGEELVDYAGGPITVEGKCERKYELNCIASLANGVSITKLIPLLSKDNLEGVTTDLSAKVMLDNGLHKTLRFKDLPLEQLASSASSATSKKQEKQ